MRTIPPKGTFEESDDMTVPEIATTAIFQSEGRPDHTARVIIDGNGVGMSIDFGNGSGPQIVNFPADAGRLQLAEALQFAADTIGSTVPGRLSPFVRGWISNAADSHAYAKRQGFWEGKEDRTNELLMWAVTEMGEIFDAVQRGNQPDPKVPEFSAAEIEAADVLIILMDLAHSNGWRVAQAVEAKMKFNNSRPYKHGKGAA